MDMNQVIVWVQIGAKILPIASTAVEGAADLVAAVREALESKSIETDNAILSQIEVEAEARAAARRAQGTQA